MGRFYAMKVDAKWWGDTLSTMQSRDENPTNHPNQDPLASVPKMRVSGPTTPAISGTLKRGAISCAAEDSTS